MKISNKTKIFIGSVLAIILIVFLVGWGGLVLHMKNKNVSLEIQKVDRNIKMAQSILDTANFTEDVDRRLISKQQLASAIDEITRSAKDRHIHFISMRPEDVVVGDLYSRSILRLTIASSYEEMGMFFKDLNALKQSVVFIKSFRLNRNLKEPMIVNTKLDLEICLRNE